MTGPLVLLIVAVWVWVCLDRLAAPVRPRRSRRVFYDAATGTTLREGEPAQPAQITSVQLFAAPLDRDGEGR